ncbi:MAG: hypothetical protein PHF19_05745 [Synergistales bacterium]|nr:hypothetical protein [Synergistales bacterium]
MTTGSQKNLALLLLFILFAAVIWFQNALLGNLVTLRREVDELGTNKAHLTASLARTTRQIQLFKTSLAEIARYQRSLPKDNVEFYALVEGRLARNGAVVNAITPTKADKGRVAVKIDFSCPYYGLLDLLADWRSLEAAIRLRLLDVSLAEDGQVSVTAELESVLEGGA